MKKNLSLLGGIILGVLLFANSASAMNSSEHDAASMLASKGVIASQSSAAGYNLGSQITRKEIMKVVMNLSGKQVTDECNNSFSDVTNDWGCKYIESALSNGFVAANPTFRPNDSITKAESMKLILKARGIEKTHNTGDWRKDYMLTAVDMGVIHAQYSDHDTKALRGWIFQASVGEKAAMMDDSGDSMMDNMEDTSNDDSMMNSSEDTMTQFKGGYEEYSVDMVGVVKNTVLFFHAVWCPSCVAADKSLQGEDFEGKDTLVLRVDYDDSEELKAKYGVTNQHTFVQIDSEGNLVKKWVGGRSLSDIEGKIQ